MSCNAAHLVNDAAVVCVARFLGALVSASAVTAPHPRAAGRRALGGDDQPTNIATRQRAPREKRSEACIFDQRERARRRALSAATAAPHKGLIVNGGKAETDPATTVACGGGLVAPDVVVTAAHCFLDKKSATGFDLGDEYAWRVALHRPTSPGRRRARVQRDHRREARHHPPRATIRITTLTTSPCSSCPSPRRAPAAPPSSRRCRSRATTTRGTRRWARRWRWRGEARRGRPRTAARATLRSCT